MTVGERIRAFAKECFRTQSRLAEAVGVSETQLSDLVKNRQVPATVTLEKFAAVGMNLNWLLTGEGPMRALGAELPTTLPRENPTDFSTMPSPELVATLRDVPISAHPGDYPRGGGEHIARVARELARRQREIAMAQEQFADIIERAVAGSR